MIKQVIFRWIKLFLAVIAISYLVSLWKKGYEPTIYTTIIGTFVIAFIQEGIKHFRETRKK